MTTPKNREKKHVHSYVVERVLGNMEDNTVSNLDLRCECGLAMFVSDPTIHKGDGPNRKIQFDEEI